MPITVQHSPNINLLGGLAQQAGFGMYQQRQDQQDFQNWQAQQKLLQESAAQQARLQLAAQEQAANQTARERGQLLDAARLGLSQQQQGIENKLRVEQLQGQNQWRVDQLQDNKDQRKNSADQQAQNQQWQWDVNSAKVLETNVDSIRSEINKLNLNDEGKKLQGELMGKLRAIQRDRALQQRPEKYADALGQWLGLAEQAKLKDYEIKVPTVNEHFQQNVIPEMIPVPQPDGTVVQQPTGRMWVREFDPKGQPKFKLEDAPKPQPGQQDPGVPLAHGQKSPAMKAPTFGVPHDPNAVPSFEEYIANPKTFNEEFSHFQKELSTEGRDGKVLPKDEDVLDAMRKRYELRMKAVRPAAAPQQAAAPQAPAPQQMYDHLGRVVDVPGPQGIPPGVPPPPEPMPPDGPRQLSADMEAKVQPTALKLGPSVNMDRLREDAYNAALNRVNPNAMQDFLKGVETDTDRLKALFAKLKGGTASSDERKEYAGLLEKIGPYLDRKKKP